MLKLNNKQYQDGVIEEALSILKKRVLKTGDVICDPLDLERFLVLKLGGLEQETFGVVYLDVNNRVLGVETLFFGSLYHTTVYPREVLKSSLACNASGVILFHNHPGGSAVPSPADIELTKRLGKALHLVDIRLLDHFIVAGSECVSFQKTGNMPKIDASRRNVE